MLMHGQHLYKSPAIEVLWVTADYYYPDWECLVDFFAIQVWKIAGMVGRGLNPQP